MWFTAYDWKNGSLDIYKSTNGFTWFPANQNCYWTPQSEAFTSCIHMVQTYSCWSWHVDRRAIKWRCQDTLHDASTSPAAGIRAGLTLNVVSDSLLTFIGKDEWWISVSLIYSFHKPRWIWVADGRWQRAQLSFAYVKHPLWNLLPSPLIPQLPACIFIISSSSSKLHQNYLEHFEVWYEILTTAVNNICLLLTLAIYDIPHLVHVGHVWPSLSVSGILCDHYV